MDSCPACRRRGRTPLRRKTCPREVSMSGVSRISVGGIGDQANRGESEISVSEERAARGI
jgi:hypothetical protein